jgi:hypothetical protein
MLKRYVYKNVNKRAVNIGGYRFEEDHELESDVLINGFNEAVSNGFLELIERKPDGVEPDATQAPQTGNTGKVKVIWHMIFSDGTEILREAEIDPGVSVDFPSNELSDCKNNNGWFKDAELTKPVNVDKAKSPKEGTLHFYGKYEVLKKEDTPPVDPNPKELTVQGGDTGSTPKEGQVTLPPLPPPPLTGDESAKADSKNK